MKAPRRFEITLTGDTHRILERENIDDGRALAYLLGRLMIGETVADDALRAWGIEVRVGKAS